MKILIYISLALPALFYTCGNATANEDVIDAIEKIITQAKNKKLYEDPTWHRLLKYTADDNQIKSSIITPDFFLSSTGQNSPEDELVSTIKAFFLQKTKNQNNHPQCRFPARFFWIKSTLNLKNSNFPEIRCTRLESWAKFNNLKSISLVMVSGHFGNPASTFGHLVIKLNNSGVTNSGNLLEQGVNFGALVPPKENTLIYVIKGLTGGYVGGFSDQKFYTQDIVYSQTEFRDMWEYDLNLSEQQRRMFVYHLWEMVGKKYIYYFLKENCGFRIKEIIELAINRPIPVKKVWYLPIDLFYSVKDLKNSNNESYVSQIRFIPSAQRLLYQEFNRLTDIEKETVNKIVSMPNMMMETPLDSYNPNVHRKIIDFLLSYYNYKIMPYDDEDIPADLKKYKKYLITKRLLLPIGNIDTYKRPPPVEAPTFGSKPALLKLGIISNPEIGDFFELGFAGVHYDGIGNVKGSLVNSELKAISISLYANEQYGIKLNNFDLISIQKINLGYSELIDESSLSWRVKTGARRDSNQCIDCLALYAQGGIGKAYRVNKNLFTYGFLDMNLQSKYDRFTIGPVIGLTSSMGDRLKFNLEVSQQYFNNGENKTITSFNARHSLSRDRDIRIKVSYNKTIEYSLNMFIFW